LLPTVFLMARGSNLPMRGLTVRLANRELNPATKCIEAHPEKSTRPSLLIKPSPKVHPTTKGYTTKVIMMLKHIGTSIFVRSNSPEEAS